MRPKFIHTASIRSDRLFALSGWVILSERGYLPRSRAIEITQARSTPCCIVSLIIAASLLTL
ncbi:MAG: hypothetical protein U0452_09925 [Anaerolineae bacterium]